MTFDDEVMELSNRFDELKKTLFRVSPWLRLRLIVQSSLVTWLVYRPWRWVGVRMGWIEDGEWARFV